MASIPLLLLLLLFMLLNPTIVAPCWGCCLIKLLFLVLWFTKSCLERPTEPPTIIAELARVAAELPDEGLPVRRV